MDKNKTKRLETTEVYLHPECLVNTDKMITTERQQMPTIKENKENKEITNNEKNTKSSTNKEKIYNKNTTSERDNNEESEDDEDDDEEDEEDEEYNKLSKKEKKLKKYEILNNLAELKKSDNINLINAYSIKSTYKSMKMEYDLHMFIKSKNSNTQLTFLCIIIIMTFLEKYNNMFDPFGIKMNGLVNSITKHEKIYISTLKEIHDKYIKTGKGIAPEIKLVLLLLLPIITLNIPTLNNVSNNTSNNISNNASNNASNNTSNNVSNKMQIPEELKKLRDKTRKENEQIEKEKKEEIEQEIKNIQLKKDDIEKLKNYEYKYEQIRKDNNNNMNNLAGALKGGSESDIQMSKITNSIFSKTTTESLNSTSTENSKSRIAINKKMIKMKLDMSDDDDNKCVNITSNPQIKGRVGNRRNKN